MSQTPHIVGMVGNDIVADSRVKKVGASAARAGFHATILCYSPTGERFDSPMGDVDVVRVPVPFAAKGKAGRVNQLIRPLAGQELAARHLGPRTIQLARRRRLEARLTEEAPRSMRWVWTWARIQMARSAIWVRRQAFRLRRRTHITWDRATRMSNLLRRRVSLRLLRPFRSPVANIYDYEVTFGPVLEDLRPDIIHAHDFHMIGVALTAARRLRARGMQTKVIYDAHELVEGLSYPGNVIDGWLAEEGGHIRDVDAVLGVSPEQAERIRERYGLDTTPTVIMNAPLTAPAEEGNGTIADDLPRAGRILVYHGNVARERGVFTLIDALAHLPEDVHVAFVAPPKTHLRGEIDDRSSELGVGHRVHLLDFVQPERLEHYLSGADMAVIPYLLTGNNDIALPNKLFEAIQSGLPILVSDMRSLTHFVTDHDIGLVFSQGDAVNLAAKATEMLGRLPEFRSRITPELRKTAGWDAQAQKLVEVYHRLLGTTAETNVHVSAEDIMEPDRKQMWGDYRPTRLAIGPRNMAGQAYLIAQAVERHLGVPAISFSVEKPQFAFPVHRQITPEAWRDPLWQTHQRRLLSATFTHVLAESGTGMLGTLNGGFIDEQMEVLHDDGLAVGILLHGSEIRDPRRHRLLPYSPYAKSTDLIKDLDRATHRLRNHLDGLDVPVFVTTPDLIEDIDAHWLPVVIETEEWVALDEAFQEELPTVLHLPTSGLLKGTTYVDEVMQRLASEGLIRYLRPDAKLESAQMLDLVESADIIVDGIVLGAYGVMSCQAMAAGRIAVANVRDVGPIRKECPIVDCDPSSLEGSMRELLGRPESWKQIGEAGREFVATYHDGSYTAHQLSSFLGLD